MARLSISEAARQAGITRQYLHKKYVKGGILTAFKDEQDRPYIESADLLRVFEGRLPGPKDTVAPVAGSLHPLVDGTLQVEVALLREQLQAAKAREQEQSHAYQERERWYQQQLEALTGAIKLLEHRPADPPAAERPRRGFFARLFGGGE